MKTPFKISAFIIVLITALWLVPKNVLAQNENINLQVFYDELGNYGTWVDNPQYGYVWVPNVDADFRPYVTNGHWEFTDYGWTWSSDYEWGWAAFHYGRWFWDEEYGNVWVPGTEWGPAWVVWKKTPEYYGWAPMTPGMSTLYSRSNEIPVESWCFVRNRDLSQNNLSNYYVDPMRYGSLIRLSSLIISMRFDSRFKYNYIYGPSQYEFQRYYGRSISPLHIYDYNRPGQIRNGDRFSIYRPQFYKRGTTSYRESRPLSYLKNRERINTSSNSYYRNPREREMGRTNGLYNNGSSRSGSRGSNNNESGRSNAGNQNNNNRGSNGNESGRTNSGTQNNNNRESNANGTRNSNTPTTGSQNNNSNRGSNASRTGNPNTTTTGTQNNNNAGRGNARETQQVNKPTTPQPTTPAVDPSKVKTLNAPPQQKPAAEPNKKEQKNDNTTPAEKKDLRSKVKPISI